jgi:hypothetical protein
LNEAAILNEYLYKRKQKKRKWSIPTPTLMVMTNYLCTT